MRNTKLNTESDISSTPVSKSKSTKKTIKSTQANPTDIDSIKLKIQSAFNGLSFDEESHTYALNGKQLISTTTYLKRFTDSFNSFHASEAKEKKILRLNPNDKRTARYYRARWKHLKDEAAIMGTRVHLYAECYPNFDYPSDWREQAILDFYKWLPKHYVVLFNELRVYDEATLHAGTVDGLLYNTKTGKLVLYDWKTNGRNINELYKNKNMKGEFSKLKSTSLNKFAVQLSDYANVINKNTGFEVEERWIIWISQGDVSKLDADRSDDYTVEQVKPNVNEPNFKLYKVKDYSDVIEKSYHSNLSELVKEVKPAVVSNGLFTKKDPTKPAYKKSKTKKSLFSKK